MTLTITQQSTYSNKKTAAQNFWNSNDSDISIPSGTDHVPIPTSIKSDPGRALHRIGDSSKISNETSDISTNGFKALQYGTAADEI
uniref:Uncharacterized protein n=1 Tax=Romanomermis culicivorax TaxID=13658 RepID=A0A915K7I7_ROMCU